MDEKQYRFAVHKEIVVTADSLPKATKQAASDIARMMQEDLDMSGDGLNFPMEFEGTVFGLLDDNLTAQINDADSIVGIPGLKCPMCGGSLIWNCDGFDEMYCDDGTFEHEELYECKDCSIAVRAVQAYKRYCRRAIVVNQNRD